MSKYILPVRVDRGSPNAPKTLVLLHGIGNNYQSWTYVLDALEDPSFRMVAMDLLGFGDAPKPRLKYTPEQHAEAVINTLDKLNITNAVIAGHSMGCIVAIAVAKQRPDLAKHLVLLGAPLYRRMPRTGWWARLLHLDSAYFAIFRVIEANPDITIEAVDKLDDIIPIIKGMQVTQSTWPAFTASLRNTIMQLGPYRDALTLKTPTLIVYGRLDVFVIKRHLKELVSQNRRYMTLKTTMGPHEITPLSGGPVAELLEAVLAE